MAALKAEAEAEGLKDTPPGARLPTPDSAWLLYAANGLNGRGTVECFSCARLLTAAHTQGRSRWPRSEGRCGRRRRRRRGILT